MTLSSDAPKRCAPSCAASTSAEPARGVGRSSTSGNREGTSATSGRPSRCSTAHRHIDKEDARELLTYRRGRASGRRPSYSGLRARPTGDPAAKRQRPAARNGIRRDLSAPRRKQEQRERSAAGTPFSRCVSAHREGVSGKQPDREAARAVCRQAFSPSQEGRKFGECVASTRNLILGLRGLRSQQ